MMDLLKLMKERHSSRVFFDPDQPVSKEDIAENTGSRKLGPYSPQYAKF